MGVLFDQCKTWSKQNVSYEPNQNGEWWEKLSIERIEYNEFK
jgi:hypothetical protein